MPRACFADRNRRERKTLLVLAGGIELYEVACYIPELALECAPLHLAPGPEPRRLMRGSAPLPYRDISTVVWREWILTRSMSLLRYTSLIISRMRPLTSVRIRPPNLPTPWSTWTSVVASPIWPSSLSERVTCLSEHGRCADCTCGNGRISGGR